MSSSAGHRQSNRPYAILRKGDLPGVDDGEVASTPQSDESPRRTGPRMKAQPESTQLDSTQLDSTQLDSTQLDSAQLDSGSPDRPDQIAPQASDAAPYRPRALSIPYATLPPPRGDEDYSDQSEVTAAGFPSIPPAAATPGGRAAQPTAPRRTSYRPRATCKVHGLALSDQGTCMHCVKERTASRSATLSKVLVGLTLAAICAASYIAATM